MPQSGRQSGLFRPSLESYFDGTPIRDEYLIVDSGVLAGTGARSYKLT